MPRSPPASGMASRTAPRSPCFDTIRASPLPSARDWPRAKSHPGSKRCWTTVRFDTPILCPACSSRQRSSTSSLDEKRSSNPRRSRCSRSKNVAASPNQFFLLPVRWSLAIDARQSSSRPSALRTGTTTETSSTAATLEEPRVGHRLLQVLDDDVGGLVGGERCGNPQQIRGLAGDRALEDRALVVEEGLDGH